MLNSGKIALDAHCRRVAGWAMHALRRRDCSAEELRGLEEAALRHHDPAALLRPEVIAGLASDMGLKPAALQAENDLSSTGLGILQSFHGLLTDPGTTELAGILEQADQFDEQFELDVLDPLPQELADEFRLGLPPFQLVDASAVLRASEKLPVFPTVAQRAMRLLSVEEDAPFERVEQVLRSDQVLAAEILRAANSALNAPRQPISTLGRAIAHIGVSAAIRIICAACLRPVFASRSLFDLWNHSLDAAETAEAIAIASGRTDPGEAFLAGLIHDIGRLAYTLLSCDYQAQSRSLLEYGCPSCLIEYALTGTSHPLVGAELMEAWAIPDRIAGAARCQRGQRG